MFRVCTRKSRRSSKVPTRKELERITDIFFADNSDMSDICQGNDDEKCMMDNDTGKFVATTAKFDGDWEIIDLRRELRPKEYFPIKNLPDL